jgi:hypothetical protein
MFLGIFHSLDWFQTFKLIYQYIESNIMWKNLHLELFIYLLNVKYTKPNIGYNYLCTC